MTKTPPHPSQNIINHILYSVSAASGIPVAALRGQGRTRGAAYARFIAVLILHENCRWLSLAELAAAIGRKDHGSALHALSRARSLPHHDAAFAALLLKCQWTAAA